MQNPRNAGGRRRKVGGPCPQGFLSQNWGENELNRSVTCMVLKSTANDRRHLALCHVEIWPLHDQVALETTTNATMQLKNFMSLVCADKPQTLDHLEDNIRHVIADIRPQMLEKVIESWTSRLDYIRASRGSPMPEIIFKNVMPQDYLSNKKFMSIE
ncbi:hypothetical protein TNCV_2897381 [Trichonephila clavipes]|nr:hypothetical protein TNCV_2897381 [Trichonephila clavipes]